MYKEVELRVTPEEAHDREKILYLLVSMLQVERGRIKHTEVIKKSIDARQKRVMMQLKLGVFIDEVEQRERQFMPMYKDVSKARPVVVVGAGPAGLFAALRLIEKGMRPIVLERGKSVEERKKDLNQLYKTGSVNIDSNYGFGEGGAGTFSDGKLFTRSKKRGNVNRILEILVYHGASESILIDAHPHIGTDKLPGVIVNIRKTIERYGGEVRFNSRVKDILIERNKVKGVSVDEGEVLADQVILATGHSARDVYGMLQARSVLMLAKEFAVGLRLEHPQEVIDRIQYHNPAGRGDFLPAAEYSFVANINGRGVYSFCMCPGGVVVPACTGPEQQVVNGMSSSGRNTAWANSAIVTSIGEEELKELRYTGLFGGMEFQKDLEYRAWREGGGKLVAPAQRLIHFMTNKESTSFPKSSYKPGLRPTLFGEWLPRLIYQRLLAGLEQFGRKSRGFIHEDALLLGVETRTSAPVRIPRLTERMVHPEIEGLYPCGEGAGYAGGIVSAAMDGEGCAEVITL
ncbi:FAD-dependent oxidoreductase [uncultured Sanguibacteroides sp.]|uniref:NAD(P)/FAD-dependent oxidoreductase n=1 Tax=uncultured Sanguibacteroides sp. TaxID=1635151 RepID=UPI0025CF22F4|nr:FAD-dependent oxidoreductase [uncultured Sanguibacteroides sp.]